MIECSVYVGFFFFSSRRRHTRCALVTGVQTCALPISSHSPLIGYADSGMPSPSCAEAFYGLMSSLAEQVAAFDPELVLVFAPDHFNGFYYEVMPPFCIGADGEIGRAHV